MPKVNRMFGLILTALLVTSTIATWITDKNEINELRERQLNETPSLIKRAVGGIYMCTDVNWQGNCMHNVYPLDTCIKLASPWAFTISSFGPDPGTACVLYSGKNCESSSTNKNIIRWWGSEDLRALAMNDRIGSFKCYQVDPNGQCFRPGYKMPIEFLQYTHNCAWCCNGCTRSGSGCAAA